jgi:hypothetical protein
MDDDDRTAMLDLRRDLDALLARMNRVYGPAAARLSATSMAAADLLDVMAQTRLLPAGATLYAVSQALSRVLDAEAVRPGV